MPVSWGTMRSSRIALFVPLLLLLAPQGHGQFDALPDSNATWATGFWIGPGYPFDGWYHEYDPSYPDTTISGSTFHRIRTTGNFGGTWYDGAIRDNELGQVFYYPPGDTVERVLYDFDVLVGDTVNNVFAVPGVADMLVITIDTIPVNGSDRKRIGIAPLGGGGTFATAHWIQGIGGDGGLLHTCGCVGVSGMAWLVCMTDNDIVQFGSNVGGTGTCEIHLGVQAPSSSADPFMPVHDPVLDVLNIAAPGSVEVVALDGRVVAKFFCANGMVPTSGLMPGMYVVRFEDTLGRVQAASFLKR